MNETIENKNSSKQIAETILRQLGGRRFQVMTGARNFGFSGEGTLTFKIPSNITRDRIGFVKIELTSMDDYTMTFYKVRGINRTTIREIDGVYCDQLQSIFRDVTGLETRL